jgi:hypothetical protein
MFKRYSIPYIASHCKFAEGVGIDAAGLELGGSCDVALLFRLEQPVAGFFGLLSKTHAIKTN